jgi:hypothetical protein
MRSRLRGLTPLALLNRAGQDLRDQIGNLLRQVFRRELLARAYDAVIRDQFLVTDEVSAVQHIGQPVFVVENTEPNPKITFPADIATAERFVD